MRAHTHKKTLGTYLVGESRRLLTERVTKQRPRRTT